MMKLTHKDISPDSDCDFEATGNNAAEVAKKMVAHVKSENMEGMEKMKGMSDADMMKMFESKAHS